MGVEEVYNYLKENEGYHSAKEISNAIGIRTQAVNKSLNVISRYDDINGLYQSLNIRHFKDKLCRTKRSWVYSYVKQRS